MTDAEVLEDLKSIKDALMEWRTEMRLVAGKNRAAILATIDKTADRMIVMSVLLDGIIRHMERKND